MLILQQLVKYKKLFKFARRALISIEKSKI
jgi:hypothetical protein